MILSQFILSISRLVREFWYIGNRSDTKLNRMLFYIMLIWYHFTNGLPIKCRILHRLLPFKSWPILPTIFSVWYTQSTFLVKSVQRTSRSLRSCEGCWRSSEYARSFPECSRCFLVSVLQRVFFLTTFAIVNMFGKRVLCRSIRGLLKRDKEKRRININETWRKWSKNIKNAK